MFYFANSVEEIEIKKIIKQGSVFGKVEVKASSFQRIKDYLIHQVNLGEIKKVYLSFGGRGKPQKARKNTERRGDS